MKCYIKDRWTFVTSGIYDVSAYDLFLQSIFDDKSKITIVTDDNITEGDIVYCDNGWLGIINAVKRDKNNTELTCEDILNLFNDDFSGLAEYLPQQEGTITNFIAVNYSGLYADNYPKYAYLYLPWPTTATPASEAQYAIYAEKGLVNGRKLIYGLLRTFNIFTECSYLHKTTGDVLRVDVTHRDSVTRKIDFSNKDYTLIKETYSKNNIGAVNVCVWDESTATLTETLWYVKTDGTVTTVRPADADMAHGVRKSVYVGATDDQETKVLDEISKVKYSHRIEFSTERELNFYDMLQLRINGRVLNSYISSVRVTSDSDRFFYTSGEMRTKLTDKIKELI